MRKCKKVLIVFKTKIILERDVFHLEKLSHVESWYKSIDKVSSPIN